MNFGLGYYTNQPSHLIYIERCLAAGVYIHIYIKLSKQHSQAREEGKSKAAKELRKISRQGSSVRPSLALSYASRSLALTGESGVRREQLDSERTERKETKVSELKCKKYRHRYKEKKIKAARDFFFEKITFSRASLGMLD